MVWVLFFFQIDHSHTIHGIGLGGMDIWLQGSRSDTVKIIVHIIAFVVVFVSSLGVHCLAGFLGGFLLQGWVDILDQRGGGGGGIMVKNNTHTHTTQICVSEEEDVTEDCTLLHFLSTTCWGWHKTKARKKSQEEKTFSNLTNPFQLH